MKYLEYVPTNTTSNADRNNILDYEFRTHDLNLFQPFYISQLMLLYAAQYRSSACLRLIIHVDSPNRID